MILNRRELTPLQKSAIELMAEKLRYHWDLKAEIERKLAKAQKQADGLLREITKELGIPEKEVMNWKLSKEKNAFVYEEPKKPEMKKEG